MTKIELLEMLKKCAIEYIKDKNSVSRNQHLTMLSEEPSENIKDAILTDFINYVGMKQCVDYALSVDDLKSE